jgi:hypothetical protein
MPFFLLMSEPAEGADASGCVKRPSFSKTLVAVQVTRSAGAEAAEPQAPSARLFTALAVTFTATRVLLKDGCLPQPRASAHYTLPLIRMKKGMPRGLTFRSLRTAASTYRLPKWPSKWGTAKPGGRAKPGRSGAHAHGVQVRPHGMAAQHVRAHRDVDVELAPAVLRDLVGRLEVRPVRVGEGVVQLERDLHECLVRSIFGTPAGTRIVRLSGSAAAGVALRRGPRCTFCTMCVMSTLFADRRYTVHLCVMPSFACYGRAHVLHSGRAAS